jgi:hypothetical protein
MTNGVRFSGQRIRLPEVPGALILEDAVSTVRLTEQIDGEPWQIIRYSYPMFVQREGRVDIKPIVRDAHTGNSRRTLRGSLIGRLRLQH